jgi:hypothetical protein
MERKVNRMKRKLTPREYALEHGMSLQGVYLRIWLKKVDATKDGRRWLISDDSGSREKRDVRTD